MKRLFYVIFFICLSAITFNCQKEISYSGGQPGNNNNNANPITAVLQGNIVDETGQPTAGVTIHVGNKATTTNSRGYFRIDHAALDKTASLVTAEKAGYFKAYRSFQATTGANHIMIKLTRKINAGVINSATGGSVTLPNGSKISLLANSVVKASGGSSYTGNVNIYAAYIDPSADDISQTVPGSFMANDKDNNRVTLVSYGMLAVELESQSVEKLQIAPGSAATLTMPIPSSLQSTAPASISLWYIDEQTGTWKEEGSAVKTGNNYVGDVKHFSFWNCDAGFPGITLSLTLKNSEGLPITHGKIRITRQGNSGQSYGWTDSLGQVSGLVPANENLVLQLLDPCNNAIYTQNIGPFTQNTNLGVLTVPNPGTTSLLTIRGQLKNCSNAPVTSGYAIISYDNVTRYAAVNNAGEFAVSLTGCPASAASCEIIGVDAIAAQQGNAVSVTITSSVVNAGTIIACGTSTNQYIDYTIDGTTYSITTAANDSLYADTYATQTAPPFATWIIGERTPNNGIALYFEHNAAVGTYNVRDISVSGYNDSLMGVTPPFTVTLTNYAASSGGFHEGTFTGKFHEAPPASTLHTISGSFRVRRY